MVTPRSLAMNLGNKRLQERFDDPEITGQNVGARLAEKAAQGRQQFSNMIRQSPSTQINQILAKNREATQNWNRVQAMQQGQGNNMTMRRRTSDPRPGPYRVPGPSMPPGLPGGGYNQAPPARRPTVDTSPTADAEVGRRRASGYPMPAQPYFPPAPQSSPSPQAGLDPRNRPAPPRAARGREAQPTGIQGIPPQAGPPQIAGQGPTAPYQAPMAAPMPSLTAQAQNPFAGAMTQAGLLTQTNTGNPQGMGGNINRPSFTYGLNRNSPMWMMPYARENDPFNYYWDSPIMGRGNVLPQFQGMPGFANEGVARQWPGWQMTPEVMSGLIQQYGDPMAAKGQISPMDLKRRHGVMPTASSMFPSPEAFTQQGLQQPMPTPFGVPYMR